MAASPVVPLVRPGPKRLTAKILERDNVYQDRVRGEWIANWDMLELRGLGLQDALTAVGSFFLERLFPHNENIPKDKPGYFTVDLTNLAPGLPPSFCMGHPAMCETHDQTAQAARSIITRCVKSNKIQPGKAQPVGLGADGAQEITPEFSPFRIMI